MAAHGFECLGPTPDNDGCEMWLLSYGARDVLVILPEKFIPQDVAKAVYDAGGRDARDTIRSKYNEFTNALKHESPAVKWEEARRLQREKQEARIAATSQPKT